jgi:hypothetical protein
MSVYLERVIVKFPNTNTEFTNNLVSIIHVLGLYKNNVLELTNSSQSFYPKLSLDFQSTESDILTDFFLSNGEVISVQTENSTGQSKQNPYPYEHLDVETVGRRLVISGIRQIGIDHVGFNLPWFSSEVHPKILQLREKLSPCCLYHRFPTGEPWDFIIPGDEDEILNHKAVDYSEVRRPKFELVSFENASTPLVQLDISVNARYERFFELFPESLNDQELRNIWVYLESPYAVDVCLVINESSEDDWSDFFKECRL